MTSHALQSSRKKAAWFLALAFIVFAVTYAPAHVVNAQQSVVVVDGTGTIPERISAVANEIASELLGSLEVKEYVLDEIAFTLAKKAMEQITKGVVDWINSGFEGSPAFITDLDQYLTNAADEVAGEIIYGSDLGFLCSPLELNIRLALLTQYQRDTNLGKAVQCTLSGVTDNVDAFLGGNFAAGGWPAWFELFIEPQNNIIGAGAIAQARLTNEILERQGRDLRVLDWGEGLLSFEQCTTLPGNRKVCKIVTPGHVIAEQLSFELSVGQRTLIEADEFNEVISALISQLGSQALQGVGGLLGLSQSSGGGPSYLDRIGNPLYDTTTTSGAGGASSAVGFIAGALADEREYRGVTQSVIDRASSVIAQAAGSCGTNASVRADATRIHDQYNALLNVSITNEVLLVNMESRYNTADAQGRLAITGEFGELQASGNLHGRVDIVRARFEIEGAMTELNQLQGRARNCSGNNQNQNNQDDTRGLQ